MTVAKKCHALCIIPALIAVFLLALPAHAEYSGTAASTQTSTYVFLGTESTLVDTGGWRDGESVYRILGSFQLSFDPNAGTAAFLSVDAETRDGIFVGPDPNRCFNLTGLTGTLTEEGTCVFEGRTSYDSSVHLTLAFEDGSVHLSGETTPSAGYSIDAVAQRKYDGGTGEPNNPYRIARAADLIALGETWRDCDKHFVLTSDIDLDPNLPGRKVFPWAVIESFSGVFDGNDHTISHLTITPGGDDAGLFGQLRDSAEVFDLGLKAASVGGDSQVGGLVGDNRGGTISNCYSGAGTVTGRREVGGLVGCNCEGTIRNCHSTGTVAGSEMLGGLVGFNVDTTTECYSTCTVIGEGPQAGGLAGYNCGRISNCYSTGTVTATEKVGGFVGENYDGNISNCYSTGAVIGREDRVGGLVGDNVGTVNRCYSVGAVIGNGDHVGGLVGHSHFFTNVHSVWDVQTSSRAGSAGGVGLTTTEMRDPRMLGLNGFGNDPNWILNAGRAYPRLAWEHTPGESIAEPQMDWLAGCGTATEPYRIEVADQLALLSKASILWDKHFILGADIDLNPKLPGGSVFGQAVIPAFTGLFDGDGYTISGLTIEGRSFLGVFGQLAAGAEVKSLALRDVHVDGSGDAVGGLVGENQGRVRNCSSSGTIAGRDWVGGLVGENRGSIALSYSAGTVAGNVNIGGLAGANLSPSGSALVSDCYSIASVSGHDQIGGLVGQNQQGGSPRASWGSISRCFSAGPVIGDNNVGGLVGANDSHYGHLAASFWDMETSGANAGVGDTDPNTTDVTSRTAAQMQTASTFLEVGWDFIGEDDGPHDIWAMPEGGGYPILCWQLPPGSSLPIFSSGTGEPNDPYRIATREEFSSIGHNPRLMESHFRLIEDLNLRDCHFYAIGDPVYPYRGTFDGNDHVISHLALEGEDYLGVFGLLGDAAEVRDLGILKVNVVGHAKYIGALAGDNDGNITNCHSTGTVSGDGTVGGLVGGNSGSIRNCHSTSLVAGYYGLGGLVGYNSGSITASCSTGAVVVKEDQASGLVGYDWGGLAGYNWGSISNCYSTSTVIGYASNVGGLVGDNWGTIAKCYSVGAVMGSGDNVGGLVGWLERGELITCFWDTETSGVSRMCGDVADGTGCDDSFGKTSAEMQTKAIFLEAGWDFIDETKNGIDNIWWIDEGQGYPRLWWEAGDGTAPF